MAKQSITVELDDETIRSLAALGKPIEVLAQLANSAAEGVRRPGHERREQTDASLLVERETSDAAIAKDRAVVEKKADDVVRMARQRADQVVQTARRDADRVRSRQRTATGAGSERARTRADDVVKHERSSADAVVGVERAAERRDRADFLAAERGATDRDLVGERTSIDTLVVDQREANEQMVRATIEAQEQMAEADAAKAHAERSEHELRAVAEFREMFIGILGHDLRNPLGSIILSTSVMLRRGRLDDQDAEMVSRIIRAAQRINRMIAQLLDLTRARLGGGLPIDPRPVDLGDVCRNVVEEFDAAVRLEVEGDLKGTWDEDRLTQVLSNIAGNAVQYAAPGTVVVVRAHAEGADVVVEIDNKGAPIPADQLPFIFEPFRRARAPEKASTGNLGLGLYIAKQIVLSHGGTLDAHSAGDKTTFVMRLPRGPIRRSDAS